MNTQEIRIQAQITLEVPIELSKGELLKKFDGAELTIVSQSSRFNLKEFWNSHLDIIEIEEEAQIYGNE